MSQEQPLQSDGATSMVTFDDVRAAAGRLKGLAHRTPVMTSSTADARAGARLFFKAENFQRAGAFKFRGAANAVAVLSADQRRRGVVAYSSGNHAQALALAASLQGAPATIVMPHDAPAVKIEATRGYGADVVFYDRYTEDREAIGRGLAKERGLALIPPYDHPDVIAGQGTATLELVEDVGPLDALFVPLGGGGLLAGGALASRALQPHTRIYGVEPVAGDDGRRSLQVGHIVTIAPPRSIADGAVVTHLGRHNFPIIRRSVDDIVTVSDDALLQAARFFIERMKIVVEPTGCLGAAAVFSGLYHRAHERVGVLLSGGNTDVPRLFSS